MWSTGLAVGDEVARAELGDLESGVVLLGCIPRDEPPEPPIGHVDEPGAVDAAPR